MLKYRLGKFIIIKERNQVTNGRKTINLEPKIMDLLCHFCKNQGKVISQQELFSVIWPGAIYNPSSVQRGVAIIRKAFEEDAKNPRVILTHPKRGYSLDSAVDVLPNNRDIICSLRGIKYLVTVSLIVMFSSFMVLELEESENYAFANLSPLISSGQRESHSNYSPDGHFIAYIKQEMPESNHIWVKDLRSGAIRRLSEKASTFISISWMKDQSAISYVRRSNKGDIVGIYPFNEHIDEPAVSKQLFYRNNSVIIERLQWTSKGNVIFITKYGNRPSEIMSYSPTSGNFVSILSENSNGKFLGISLSKNGKSLALVQDGKQNNYLVSVLDLYSKELKLLTTVQGYVKGIDWHPNNNNLLLSIREYLLLVDINGTKKKLKFSNFLNIQNASYNPTGDEITLTLAGQDLDIVETRTDKTESKKVVDSSSIDMQPLYSSQSNRFAFVTTRSGRMQIYLYENGVEQLLLDNNEKKEFFGMAWSPDGRKLAIALERRLHIVDLNNFNVKSKQNDLPSFYVRDWYNNENALLVNLLGPKPAKLDLNTMKLTLISTEESHCAVLDGEDNIFANQKSKIVRIDANGSKSIFWETEQGEIQNLSVFDKGIVVEIKSNSKKELLAIEFTQKDGKYRSLAKNRENLFSDISTSGDYILSMTKPRVTSTVAILK